MFELRVEAIKDDTPDTKTFFLKEVGGEKIAYKAGQFITLVFNHKPTEIRRSFSLSSSPDEDQLAITVKRIPNGEISRYLFANTRLGDVWNALPPAGKFTVPDDEQIDQLFYFAAGSGITPVYAQLKYILGRKGHSKLTLVYSNRNEKDTLFYHELNALSAQHPERLTLIYLFSDAGLLRKRLNNELVITLVNEYLKQGSANARFFICGPFTYMRMVRLTLIYMGFEDAQIRRENFVIETASAPVSRANFAPRNIKLQFKGALYNLPVAQNQTILDAALKNNIALPYSCKAGICSSCSAICRVGRVEMPVNDVLTDADLAQGWILTCTAHPVTDDVLIEFL